MKGFHTLELVIVLAITCITITLGMISLKSFLTKNSLAQAYELFHDLHYARHTSITQNTPIYICASKNQQDCSLEEASGYILYTLKNKKKQIIVSNHFRNLVILLRAGFGTHSLYFTPMGLCNVSASFYVQSRNFQHHFRIVILASGRIRLEKNIT